jgi:hypothetical protein
VKRAQARKRRFLDEKFKTRANTSGDVSTMLSNEIDIGSEKDRDHHSRCRPRTAPMDGVDSRRVIARSNERLPNTIHRASPACALLADKPSV